MASWIDELRPRCGPLTDAASLFAASLGVESDPPAGAAGLLVLARGVERHLDRNASDDDDERLFVELAGSFLGVLLCGALPQGRHASRDGRHGVLFGARRFFDPFEAVERLLDAEDVRACLAEQVSRAEDAARGAEPAFAEVQARLLPRLVGPRLLAEVTRSAGTQPLCVLPLLADMHVLFLLGEEQRRRYVGAREAARWGQHPADLLRHARANLAGRSDAARLLRFDAEHGSLVVARSGDGLDSSRLLLPGLHDVLAPELGSPFVAAVPHRDALFACALRDATGLRLLRERAADEAARAAHPITATPLAVGPNGQLALLPG